MFDMAGEKKSKVQLLEWGLSALPLTRSQVSSIHKVCKRALILSTGNVSCSLSVNSHAWTLMHRTPRAFLHLQIITKRSVMIDYLQSGSWTQNPHGCPLIGLKTFIVVKEKILAVGAFVHWNQTNHEYVYSTNLTLTLSEVHANQGLNEP